MTNHRLIQILKTFTKEEFSEFEKFIASPFHNNGRNFLPLVKELKKYYPLFNSKKFTKENVFGKIYKGKKYSESLVNTTLSRVYKMTEEYFGFSSYKRKHINAKHDYIQELLNRDLYSIAEKELNNYSKMLEPDIEITDDLIKARMDREILKVQLKFKSDKQQESAEPALKQLDYHIRFTLMRLAHFAHTLRVNNIIFNIDYNKTFVKKYLDSVNLKEIYFSLKNSEDSNELDEITLIYVLWTLGVTDLKEESYFYEMKELVLKNLDKFHHHEKYNLFQALEALAWILQQEVNREKYEIELLDVYKKRIKHKVLSPDKTYMRVILFRAVLITSFYEPDWEFIDGFIKTCIPLLQEEHRENMYNYSMAHINYHKGRLDKALQYNNKINFELFAFKYDTRLLHFKIYYELGYYEQAHSLIDAHRHFISTNKTVSEYYKEMHSSFLGFYSKLLKRKEGSGNTEPGILIKEISKINNIIAKQWLIDKANEFLSP